MKYYTTQNLYKASNVQFDPETIRAYSYGWWEFVRTVGDKVVFNNFPYSNTTIKHQWKVRRLMNDLGIQIDVEVSGSGNLSDLASFINQAIQAHRDEIAALERTIAKPRTRQSTNDRRRQEIANLVQAIEDLEGLKEKE